MNVDELIKIYFKNEEWEKLSELKKANYRNAYNTYQECLSQGIVLPEPDFMTVNERRDCETIDAVKDVEFIDYKEVSPPFDSHTYCDTCEEEFEDFCIGCGMLLHILDNNVRSGTKYRAKKTLPKNLLEVKQSSSNGESVFALRTIPKGIHFGPYEGLEALQTTNGYAWNITDRKLQNVSELSYSNWMRYVNYTKNEQELNLIAFQCEGGLYYRTVKTINKGDELLVFYSKEFTEILIDDKKYFKPDVEKEIPNVYACSPCCLGFSSEKYLKKHIAKCPHKIPEEDPLEGIVPCPFCNIYLTNMKYLENHMKHCRARFRFTFALKSNPSDKKSNQKVEFNIEERHKCSKCSYQTNDKGNLKTHFQTHDGLKPFECTECNKKFTLKGNLKKHLTIHSNEKVFKCKECSYTCNSKSTFSYHIKYKHTMEKGYSCNFCVYKTVSKSNLINHLRKHTKERPFKCKICNKIFTQRTTLKTHLNIHLNIKYQCSQCNYSSHYRENFNRHYKAKHGNCEKNE